MEKVTRIGGLFFRAHDPKALGSWYQQHLGVSLTPSSYDEPVWEREAGPTVFGPFPETSDYFGGCPQGWMVNFRVRDLDKMAAQPRTAGIDIKIDPKPYPNGRFARLYDRGGNPIELWQPAKPNAPRWVTKQFRTVSGLRTNRKLTHPPKFRVSCSDPPFDICTEALVATLVHLVRLCVGHRAGNIVAAYLAFCESHPGRR